MHFLSGAGILRVVCSHARARTVQLNSIAIRCKLKGCVSHHALQRVCTGHNMTHHAYSSRHKTACFKVTAKSHTVAT
jgi:hypothetical protein